MSRILADITQKPQSRQFATAVVLVHDEGIGGEPGKPVGAKIEGRRMPSGRWNRLAFPEKLPCGAHEREALDRVSARRGRRQHQATRNVVRFYTPQDQRGVQTVFVVMDRETGQVLARVRGSAAHCEIEAEKLARSQGCEFADLKVVFEGELTHV